MVDGTVVGYGSEVGLGGAEFGSVSGPVGGLDGMAAGWVAMAVTKLAVLELFAAVARAVGGPGLWPVAEVAAVV